MLANINYTTHYKIQYILSEEPIKLSLNRRKENQVTKMEHVKHSFGETDIVSMQILFEADELREYFLPLRSSYYANLTSLKIQYHRRHIHILAAL